DQRGDAAWLPVPAQVLRVRDGGLVPLPADVEQTRPEEAGLLRITARREAPRQVRVHPRRALVLVGARPSARRIEEIADGLRASERHGLLEQLRRQRIISTRAVQRPGARA